MRIWSIHPKYLDSKGLVALWREALLAQKVLQGQTKGYIHHSQLIRFKELVNPVGAVADYLRHVVNEANNRNYRFSVEKISPQTWQNTMRVGHGQIMYEFQHLLNKLSIRAPMLYEQLKGVKNVMPHPLFEIVEGGIECWEIL